VFETLGNGGDIQRDITGAMFVRLLSEDRPGEREREEGCGDLCSLDRQVRHRLSSLHHVVRAQKWERMRRRQGEAGQDGAS
jgi:hypothetical protein